ncbi:MAG: 50S ribosomal protein L14e [bacterium]|nr:50S ribosomal protein L14e [bacterium]
MVFEVGRLVVKLAGRDAGRLGVIVRKVDELFVVVTGPKKFTGLRRRKVNIRHLEPLQEKIDIPEDAPDEVVWEKLKEVLRSWPEEKLRRFKLRKELLQ